MTDIDIVAAYYAVAADLHIQADRKREVAEMLSRMADAMDDARARDKSKQVSETR